MHKKALAILVTLTVIGSSLCASTYNNEINKQVRQKYSLGFQGDREFDQRGRRKHGFDHQRGYHSNRHQFDDRKGHHYRHQQRTSWYPFRWLTTIEDYFNSAPLNVQIALLQTELARVKANTSKVRHNQQRIEKLEKKLEELTILK